MRNKGDFMRKAVTAIICAFIVLIPTISIAQIEPAQWAVEAIKKAEAENISYAAIKNDYTQDITREEFCNIAVRMCEYLTAGHSYLKYMYNEEKPFSDTDSKAVVKAYSLGLIKGKTQGKFFPSEKITREEAAVIFGRVSDYFEYDAEKSELNTFSDYAEISPWAEEALSKLYSDGVIKGVSETEIAPLKPITRQEAVVMAVRMCIAIRNEDIYI